MPPKFFYPLLVGFIGRQFVVNLKNQPTTVSGTLNQVTYDVIIYTPSDSDFTEGFLAISEIGSIEFRPPVLLGEKGGGTNE